MNGGETIFSWKPAGMKQSIENTETEQIMVDIMPKNCIIYMGVLM